MEDFWYGMEENYSMEYGKIVFHSIPYHALVAPRKTGWEEGRHTCVKSQSKWKLLTVCAKFMDLAFCYEVTLNQGPYEWTVQRSKPVNTSVTTQREWYKILFFDRSIYFKKNVRWLV